MIYELVISVVFRILNFAVLCGFAAYIYKKYLHHKVLASIDKKKRFIERLHHQHESIERHYTMVCAAAQQHTQQYELLNKKLEQWKAIVAQQQVQRLYEKNDRMRILKERADFRFDAIEAKVIEKRVMPLVLENTYHQACKKFHGQAGQQFVQRIVAQLQEGK